MKLVVGKSSTCKDVSTGAEDIGEDSRLRTLSMSVVNFRVRELAIAL
jgi:hypothetical protein